MKLQNSRPNLSLKWATKYSQNAGTVVAYKIRLQIPAMPRLIHLDTPFGQKIILTPNTPIRWRENC